MFFIIHIDTPNRMMNNKIDNGTINRQRNFEILFNKFT